MLIKNDLLGETWGTMQTRSWMSWTVLRAPRDPLLDCYYFGITKMPENTQPSPTRCSKEEEKEKGEKSTTLKNRCSIGFSRMT